MTSLSVAEILNSRPFMMWIFYFIFIPKINDTRCNVTVQFSNFYQALINQGAVMEERQGWERPGWYLPEGTVQVLPYDYQGSYGSSKNEQDLYTEILKKDYTFDFPEHQNIVR